MENKQEFTLKRFLPLIYMITVILIALIAFKASLYLLPFVIAFIVVTITRGPVNFLVNKFNFSNRMSNIIVILLFYLIIPVILILLLIRSYNEIYNLSNWLIKNANAFKNIGFELFEKYNFLEGILPSVAIIPIKNFITMLLGKLTNLGFLIANYVLSLTLKLPVLFVHVIITITATFLMAGDIETVHNFFEKQFPKVWLEKFRQIKVNIVEVAYQYLRAQLILVSLCFTELIIGLSIINIFVKPISYVFLTSMLIALFDALPIFGAGGILLPWAAYCFLTGNYLLGISILFLYVFIVTMRMTFEPRILSKSLSINPLLSLISLFVGFKVFGVVGFLFGPIILTIMIILFKEEINKGFFKILAGEYVE
ncbi:sporulation integral membrane protein YtvI [Streptobacillus moniliformis]|uniref:Sporulation integral membrane protein YtvI n=1 Tax=Streptobacillus moniliformis (strain ATCC 14647 / DSM 12112 / NCTC 10651 / 9901) TaxID=519441 RepID=D1AXT0_STRM9|nr:sporulation integral membrane protein YtvI [Streptobacillus moniliformis]ACZ01106.1 sporulation integral membrane protein YtvI [Streptobacillus moniliformis DSM 12112]AVL42528.1 sporulation integral membrane protein YtvI [Streptobacillus moniliformis]SQA13752.1 sporulation integral membrane protein YtvI [Streptobacillus moniliformis]